MSKRLKRLKKLLQGTILDIYGEKYSRDLFSEFARLHCPCVIVNSMNAWPALELWQPPWIRFMELIPFFSKIRVAVSMSSFSGVDQKYIDMTFFEFLNKSSDESFNCYMAQCPLLSDEGLFEELTLSSLVKDIKKPNVISNQSVNVHLWMNVKPVISETHYDSYQNLLCIINGSKFVELVPPSAMLKSYSVISDVHNHTLNRPRAAYEINLKKGDILYIPEGWWHRVESSENTVALSYTWKGIDQQALAIDLRGELDVYITRNAIKRMAVKRIDQVLQKKANDAKLDAKILENISAGDSELINELFEEYGIIQILYNAPPTSVRRLLTKMKKSKELIKFLKSLNAEEGYLIMKKLDECDTEPITEFTNDLYDGSKVFLRMKEILTRHKIFMVKKAVNFVINRVT
ncbi:hypothetical protein SteCoe_26381 [Stentor coeruleus]|uniref:JmjC domain-containing protein n=1 Tax=Stentor coeruleus TaxID=5963 RepID=A0A1R2BCZ6_9CILI|nr:hypothetical protein SteCoe_26381 [Stentor coeruleus]